MYNELMYDALILDTRVRPPSRHAGAGKRLSAQQVWVRKIRMLVLVDILAFYTLIAKLLPFPHPTNYRILP